MSKSAHILERGVRDDLVPAVDGVARALGRAIRSVARGIEGVVERIEAVEAQLAEHLANIGNKRVRATLLSAWSANAASDGLGPATNDPDQPAPDGAASHPRQPEPDVAASCPDPPALAIDATGPYQPAPRRATPYPWGG